MIDIGEMDVEAFNDFATEQGWSDGMPLYPPTEEKVAKFVEIRCAATTGLCAGAAATDRADAAEHRRQRGDGGLQARVFSGGDGGTAACSIPSTICTARWRPPTPVRRW